MLHIYDDDGLRSLPSIFNKKFDLAGRPRSDVSGSLSRAFILCEMLAADEGWAEYGINSTPLSLRHNFTRCDTILMIMRELP